MKSLLYFFVFVMLVSCVEKENGLTLAGEYSGTFYRTRDNIKILESSITLNFDSGSFSGGGENNQAPAICRGKYSHNENEINFTNECFFTANFDWTLILSGKFSITETDESIILSKEIDAQNGDYYQLDKVRSNR